MAPNIETPANTLTMTQIVKVTRSTFELVIRAIESTGIKGRVIDGTRVWTMEEVREINSEINV